jgi:hypothetical protein
MRVRSWVLTRLRFLLLTDVLTVLGYDYFRKRLTVTREMPSSGTMVQSCTNHLVCFLLCDRGFGSVRVAADTIAFFASDVLTVLGYDYFRKRLITVYDLQVFLGQH